MLKYHLVCQYKNIGEVIFSYNYEKIARKNIDEHTTGMWKIKKLK